VAAYRVSRRKLHADIEATKMDIAQPHFYVDVLGVRTFVVKRGQGMPLVLIHGAAPGGCSLINWKHNITPLASAGFTVYAFDQPGFGLSAIPDDHSMEFRVAHAHAVLRDLSIERCHLVGNSLGAYIAARIALEQPRVERLVLVSSGSIAPEGSAEAQAKATMHAQELRSYEPSLLTMREMTLKTLYRSELATDEFIKERYEMSVGPLYEAMQKRRKAPAPSSLTDMLGKIANKALIIWGNNDRGVALERGISLFHALPNAEFHLFNHCAHWAQWDQLERFNKLVPDFLLDND
jgi:2-hydroxy-6-oxonona-2,4-dienedioate hydrolase